MMATVTGLAVMVAEEVIVVVTEEVMTVVTEEVTLMVMAAEVTQEATSMEATAATATKEDISHDSKLGIDIVFGLPFFVYILSTFKPLYQARKVLTQLANFENLNAEKSLANRKYCL